jgi:hypothetical protein
MNVSKRAQTILGVLAAVSMAVPAAARPFVEIGAARDNTLFEDEHGTLSSGAGAYLFAGNTSQHGLRRAVVAFDLAAIPADATIDSVFLRVHVSLVNNESARPLSAHLLISSWGEGSSDSGTGGSGAPAQMGDATWVHRFHPDQEWASPGGDFSFLTSGLVSTTGIGHYTLSGEGLAADVRTWIDDPKTAHGWVLRGDESEPTTARRIDSRENPAPENRPTLIVYFTPDIDPVIEESWGRVKARF